MTNESKGMMFGVLGVIAFGLTLPVTRFVVPYLDPLFIGLGRAVVAAIVAGALLLITRQSIPSRPQIYRLLIISAGVVLGFPLLSAWAMQTVPASHGGVVLGLLPLATAIVGVLISHERPSMGFWFAGIVGSALVVGYALLEGVGTIRTGDLALLGAIVSAAVGYAFGGLLSKELGGWQVICWALVVSLPFIIVPVWFSVPVDPQQIPLSVWTCFAYLALVSQLFGFFFWNRGLAMGGIARVSQTQLLQPFITLVASALLVGEVIDSLTLLFALLVVCTVAIGKKMPIHHAR